MPPRKKSAPAIDKPEFATQFDHPIYNRHECSAEVCNYKPARNGSTMAEWGLMQSRMRGHLSVVHGYSGKQVATVGSRAHKFFRAAMGE